MRYPKFLINAFATLGVFAFIFLACSVSADNSVDDENSSVVNSIGKYQLSSYAYSNSANYIDVLDTETGIVKHYVKYGGSFILDETFDAGN